MLGVVDPAITVLVALNAVDLGGNGEGRQLFASGLNNAEAFTLDPTQLSRVASAALASERASSHGAGRGCSPQLDIYVFPMWDHGVRQETFR
jgi:hypothetical protein